MKFKLIICKEEHDADIFSIIESKAVSCLDIGELVLLYDQNDESFKHETEKNANKYPNVIFKSYNAMSKDEELNNYINKELSDAKIYWLKGNGALCNRITKLNKFIILPDECLDTYLNKYSEDDTKTPLPKFIGITLTNKCNYRCFFCNRESNDKYGTIELDHFYNLKPLIENAEILNLTGWGEPFSYKHIKEVLKFINDNNTKNCISLTSNGSVLTEELAELLSKNLNQLIISINAATKETYERDMENGNWEKVISNIKNARKYIPRKKIHFVFVGHRDNIHEFPEFVKLAAELDVWMVELLHLQVTKLEHIKKSLWFHKENTNKYIDEAFKVGNLLNVAVHARKFDNDYENKINKFDCTAPFDQAYISESGNVAPCCYSGIQNMGNVHFHDGFQNIWNNKKYSRLRSEKYFPECETCGNANSLNNLMTHINVMLVNDPKVYEQLPLVSVVVPSYNQAEWLPKTLDSLIAQSYPVWEAVVVDDGSTDNTWEVIQGYSKKDNRIKGIHKENGGISSALNKGIENGKGKYFCWLSSDDLFYPNKLELQVKAFENLDDSYGIIFGSFNLIDSKDKVEELTLNKPFIDGLEFPQQLKFDMIDGCTVMLPMKVMHEMKGFNTQFKHAQDTEFWFRLAAKGYKFFYIDKKLVKRRMHESQGFTDFQLDCRYDGYAIVQFYLSRYSFRDFYRNINWTKDEDLKNFILHFFDMITNDACHINHPVLNDHFWEWFLIGMQTLDKNIRKIIFKKGLDTFRSQQQKNSFTEKYLKRFELALQNVNVKSQLKYAPNNNFEDILLFDRSKEDLYSTKLYEFGLKAENLKDIGTAASVFKYLADYPNKYMSRAFSKFVEWCFTYEEYQKFIKSFRRKEKITLFDDYTKLYFIWAKLSTGSEDGIDEIICSISADSIKEIVELWLEKKFIKTKLEMILSWNYQVIPYKVEHFCKIKCEKCGTENYHLLSFQLSQTSTSKPYICTKCFTAYALSDSLLKEYFAPKFVPVEKNKSKINRSPKVAFVMRYTDIIGGGVKVAFKHMQWLSDLGCEITIYSDAPKPEWTKLPGRFLRVKDHYEINNINADAVIVFSVYDIPKILTKIGSNKVYHLCQGYEGYHIGRNYEEMRSDKYFYTTLHSFNVGNILVSNHLMRMFEEKFNRRGHYVPNAIDLNTYYPNTRIQKEKNSILFIGNPNDPLKGMRFLTDSIINLQNSNEKLDHISLYVVWGGTKLNGEGRERDFQNIKINYLQGLSGKEVAELMNRVSLVVNCSWYEGFTLPVLEAMACGTPTITTSNMGAESFCVDQENSFVINYGDHAALRERIKDILLQRVDLQSIIRKGFETAVEYSGINGAEKFIKEYSEILKYEFDTKKVEKLLGRFNNNIDSLKSKLDRKLKLLSNSGVYDVSIIIVTYNQIKYTLECIESIRRFTNVSYEIIVVDNSSIDDTKKEIEKQDDIVLICNDTNRGFPAAVNQGITSAQGKYVLLINNDVVVTEGWLEKLLEVAKNDPQIGLVGPISNEVSGLQRDENAKYKSIDEMHNYSAEISVKNKGHVLPFPRIAFLCTLIKKEVIIKIGGLDERFTPGNYEDDDFCLRTQLAGFKTVIAKDIFIHHYGSKSFKADGNEKYYERLKINEAKFVEKWGVTPDELWINNKAIKEHQIYYPINSNLFKQYFDRTTVHISDQELELAMESIAKAIEHYRNNDEGLILKEELYDLAGNISLAANDPDSATKYFENELVINPNSSAACLGLGIVFEIKQNLEAAKAMYEWAVKNDVNNIKAADALAKVNQELGLEIFHNSLTTED